MHEFLKFCVQMFSFVLISCTNSCKNSYVNSYVNFIHEICNKFVIFSRIKGAVPNQIAREPRGEHLPSSSLCYKVLQRKKLVLQGVTKEKAARNITTFHRLPSSDMVAVWHDK